MKSWIIFACCAAGFVTLVQGQVARDDFFTAPAGALLSVSAPGVLTNDTGSGSLTALLVSGPANGALTLNANGSFTYTPTNNFTGMDGFTYRASNGSMTSGVASVDIMVLPPGEYFFDDFTRPTNSSSIVPWIRASDTHTVLGNWSIASGLMSGNGPNYSYGYAYYTNSSWTDYSVQAQMRFPVLYAASAGVLGRLNPVTGAHYAAWVYPEQSNENNIDPLNGIPRLQLIKYQTWTNYTLLGQRVSLSAVGTNWHTVKLAFQGSNVLAYFDGLFLTNIADNGAFDGHPAYTNGGIGLNMWTSGGTPYTWSVDNVIVIGATVANNDSYQATNNIQLRVAAPGILGNDIGSGILTPLLVAGPTNGNLTLTNNGGFSYTPTNNLSSVDAFTYRCTDGVTTSAVATATITLIKSAAAADDAYSTPANTPLLVSLPGVLGNDQSGIGPLTAILSTGPANGSLILTNNGGFRYTPSPAFSGTDSFTYRCTDGVSTSGVATVTISVIQTLVANNDFYVLSNGPSLNVLLPGVLLNDVGATSAILMSGPANGNISWPGDGSFLYTPTNNYTGVDGFTYRASTGFATSGVATVEIMVPPPGGFFYDNFQRPTSTNSIFPWVQQSGTWGITNHLLNGTSAFNSYGNAYYNANWTNYYVQARIRYPSTNAWGGAIAGRLNSATGARYDVWIFPENSPWGPQNGSPAGVATMQIMKYQNWTTRHTENLVALPGVGTNWHDVRLAFQGSNVFAYFDGNLITNLSDNGSFDGTAAFLNGGIGLDMWTVSPTAYALLVSNVTVNPLVMNDSYTVNANTILTVTNPGVLNNDFDVFGTNLTATLVNGPANGTVNLSSNGGFTYTPTADFTGSDGFTVQVSDKSNQLGISTATIVVAPVAATLTVTADNQARAYGTMNPAWTVSYAGFVNGDGTNVLAGSPSLNASADTTSPTGSYAITVGQGTLSATNYGFHFVNGSLTVTPATLTITAGNTNKTYGQSLAFAGTEFSSSGLVNGNTVGQVSLASGGMVATAGVNGSPYLINVSNAIGVGLSNYSINYLPGSLAVYPAGLTITAEDKSRMYSLANPILTATYAGFVNGEDTNVLTGSLALNTTANPSSPAGAYPITVTQGTLSDGNYNFTFSDGILTVTPAQAPVIISFGITNQICTVTWSSVTDAIYQLQAASNLNGAAWTGLLPDVSASGSTVSRTNFVGNVPQQFYRVQLLTP